MSGHRNRQHRDYIIFLDLIAQSCKSLPSKKDLAFPFACLPTTSFSPNFPFSGKTLRRGTEHRVEDAYSVLEQCKIISHPIKYCLSKNSLSIFIKMSVTSPANAVSFLLCSQKRVREVNVVLAPRLRKVI